MKSHVQSRSRMKRLLSASQARLHWVTLPLLVSMLPAFAPSERPICEVEMTVALPKDVAQPLGSLFEVIDVSGRPIAGAFAPESSSLFGRSDGRRAQFYVEPDSIAVLPAQRLPRPFADIPASTLFTLEDSLYAVTRPKLGSGLVVLDKTGWRPVNNRPELVRNGLQFAVSVQGKILVASDLGVEWGGSWVFRPEPELAQKYFYYYSSGTLVAYRYGDTDSGVSSRVSAYHWAPDDPEVDAGLPFASEDLDIDYPLCFGRIGDRIVFSTNSTKRIYTLDASGLKAIFEFSGPESWQGYGMVRYRGSLLVGQYPTGQCFSTDGLTVQQCSERLPLDAAWSWELQCFGFFRGRLVAGVWPWGQLFGFDGVSWTGLARVFSAPAVEAVSSPFESSASSTGLERNQWGQRINSIVGFQGELFVSTMNKTGSSDGADAAGGVAGEYGSVTRFKVANQLDWQFRWGQQVTLVFRIWRDRAEVLQDGNVVAVAKGSFENIKKAVRIRWGDGVSGEFCGLVSDARFKLGD